jgi:peptide/nickel transport system ATP-binding protein
VKPSPLLEVRDLEVAFRQAGEMPLVAVRGVDFTVPPCATVALVGESGSGKSVTALSILRLLPESQAHIHERSRILWEGRNLLEFSPQAMRTLRRRSLGMIFQDPQGALNPVFTIGMQLGESVRRAEGMGSARQVRRRSLELLAQVGIANPETRLSAYPHQLSGGQQQRVMIAMAISTHPQLLIADEPTTALDVTVQRQIMTLLRALQRDLSMAILFITHDLALVGEIADEVVVMRQGRVVEQGRCSEVLVTPRHDYTRALLTCRPPLGNLPERLPVLDDQGNLMPARDSSSPRSPDPLSVALEVEGVSKSFVVQGSGWRRARFQALEPLGFVLQTGRTLGVVGESGSGKSTLARMVAGILAPDTGRIHFPGAEVTGRSGRATQVQMVFQNPFASLNPRFTIAQLLTEPLMLQGLGSHADERLALAVRWLERVGLNERALNRYPHEFSGGQRQRIAIARCLTVNPRVLICDESVSALDVSVQAQVLNLLRDLQDELDLSLLFISHDLAVVRFMADEILVLYAGQVVERGKAEDVYARPRHPYTQQLLKAIPQGIPLSSQGAE